MYELSQVEDSEDRYGYVLCSRLSYILQADVGDESSVDRNEADVVITLQIGDTRVALLVVEMKQELTIRNCDPSLQAGLSMRHVWIDSLKRDIRDRCCCPTFLIAVGGPWLCVLGGVLTDRIIVQRLTDMKWMALSSTEEDARIYHNARLFIALRQCLAELKTYYEGLGSVPPCEANEPHPRYYPYPSSYTSNDGTLVHFDYLETLEEDAACVTYLAQITNQTTSGDVTTDEDAASTKIVVKFVARYGKEVHELLAREGHAPRLRYYGSVSGIPSSGVLPSPAERSPPGLCLRSDLMYMVVMDYVEASSKTPSNARQQISPVLTLLHSNGYVFGDLRGQNVLFDADGNIKFIDFNWCGRYDMNIRDKGLPAGLQKEIDKLRINQDGGPYTRYPLSMSTVTGMWATGMTPLAPIRPCHDWAMLEKISWT
ncbi:hypothetical protein BDN70DRAFT_801214 [Pholiota conissans]|uniref:Protein kinase domain-containing protein n=1 Tax=Pholiota conissans TaxID=109636 RepID=A0A9P5Z712_9AGAR|nr:hypothetical protein BDN70DRAFT_801214 [Pholiota conissans]